MLYIRESIPGEVGFFRGYIANSKMWQGNVFGVCVLNKRCVCKMQGIIIILVTFTLIPCALRGEADCRITIMLHKGNVFPESRDFFRATIAIAKWG